MRRNPCWFLTWCFRQYITAVNIYCPRQRRRCGYLVICLNISTQYTNVFRNTERQRDISSIFLQSQRPTTSAWEQECVGKSYRPMALFEAFNGLTLTVAVERSGLTCEAKLHCPVSTSRWARYRSCKFFSASTSITWLQPSHFSITGLNYTASIYCFTSWGHAKSPNYIKPVSRTDYNTSGWIMKTPLMAGLP